MSSDRMQGSVPLSPSIAYRVALARDYRRVVLGCGSRTEWERQGLMTKAERMEHLRVWMAHQNQELFKPLFERDNVTPEEVHGLAHNLLPLYLDADLKAGQQLRAAIRAVAQLGGSSARHVLPMLHTVSKVQQEATDYSDKVRYAQAAELEYLRPLAWRQ